MLGVVLAIKRPVPRFSIVLKCLFFGIVWNVSKPHSLSLNWSEKALTYCGDGHRSGLWPFMDYFFDRFFSQLMCIYHQYFTHPGEAGRSCCEMPEQDRSEQNSSVRFGTSALRSWGNVQLVNHSIARQRFLAALGHL